MIEANVYGKITVAKYTWGEFLELTSGGGIIELHHYQVKTASQRYRLFKKSRVCCACGLEGAEIHLDTTNSDRAAGRAHFNLYGIKDGELVLMTKDHIVPKSKGGPNRMDNYQTMCSPCNGNKGNEGYDMDPQRVQTLRTISGLDVRAYRKRGIEYYVFRMNKRDLTSVCTYRKAKIYAKGIKTGRGIK